MNTRHIEGKSAMFGLGITELLLILLVLILFFGAKRLPELARNLGRGIKEFQREMKSDRELKDKTDQ